MSGEIIFGFCVRSVEIRVCVIKMCVCSVKSVYNTAFLLLKSALIKCPRHERGKIQSLTLYYTAFQQNFIFRLVSTRRSC